MSVFTRVKRYARNMVAPVAALCAIAAAGEAGKAYAQATGIVAFTIPASDLLPTVAQCQGLPAVEADAGTASVAEAQLDAGICMYHVLRSGTDKQGLLDTVSALEAAETGGLDRARQATANLLEGLASCRVATLELQPNLAPDKGQSTLFCLSRRSATANFSALRVPELRVSYAQDVSQSMDTLMTAMTACYSENGGPLNHKYDAGCAIYDGLDAAGIQAVANNAYADVSSAYLLGASGKITAMFSRKVDLATATLKEAGDARDSLVKDSNRIGDDLTKLQSGYSPIAARVDPLVKDYMYTWSTSSAVMTMYNGWSQGLFQQTSPTVENLAETKLKPADAIINSLNASFASNVAPVNAAIKALQTRASLNAVIQQNARALCREFYCEMAVKEGKPFSTTSSYKAVCNKAQSPLCNNQNTSMSTPGATGGAGADAGPTTFTMDSFCAAVGFPQQYIAYGMTRATSDQCWANPQ